MSEHTKEPWGVVEGGSVPGAGHAYVMDSENSKVCYPKREDARRIVACVNACAGIPTETLENDGTEIACNYVSAQRLKRMQEQRDKLLAALKKAVSRQAYKPGTGPDWWEECSAIIAEVEAGL